jgi:hypothetical protein
VDSFENNYRYPKSKIITFRADQLTTYFLEELMKEMKTTKLSNVIRTCIIFTLTLHSDQLTARKALKEECLNKIIKGEDMPLSQALKPLGELYKIAFEIT